MARISKIKEDFVDDLVSVLKILGHEALIYAYKEGHTDKPHLHGRGRRVKVLKRGSSSDGKWRHRTGNLHDSFASAVYYNGNLIPDSVQYLGNPISKKRDPKTGLTGRQTVDDYLQRMSFGITHEEVVLIVVAAMYYTKHLEGSEIQDKFKVVSPARKFIDRNWERYVAPVYSKYGIKGKPKARVIKGERFSNE